MTTYGPFYPSVLTNVSQGGTAWSISGASAEVSLPAEGVTDFLVATNFNAAVPANSVIKEVRIEVSPAPTIQSGVSNSDQFIVGPLGEQQAYVAPPVVRVEADSTPGLAADVVNANSFGFKMSYYSEPGGVLAFESLAMYVDCE